MKIAPRFAPFLLEKLTERIVVMIGGYGSGKSMAIAQKLLIDYALRKKTKIAIIRKVFGTHVNSTYSLMKRLIQDECPNKVVGKLGKNTNSIQFSNGSEIIFLALDNPEKLKSLDNVEVAWIEEASEIYLHDFTEITGRLRTGDTKIILSSNPLTTSNWLYRYFFVWEDDKTGEKTTIVSEDEFYSIKDIIKESDIGGVKYHHSTVMDNPFVTEDYIKQLRAYKRTDPFKYEVAFKGKFGVLGERVFENITVGDYSQMREGTQYLGFDLGDKISYNALVDVRIKGQDLYIVNEWYDKDMTIPEIADEFRKFGIPRGKTVWNDTNFPQTINTLKPMLSGDGISFQNAKKGAGSVQAGIQKIKSYNIHIDKRCRHTLREFKELAYKEINGIKQEDKYTLDPHTVDAIRYAICKVQMYVPKGDFSHDYTGQTLYSDNPMVAHLQREKKMQERKKNTTNAKVGKQVALRGRVKQPLKGE
ncbi:MAG: hypothetical protein BV458_03505 [Thermoplasmata archaeon M9B2D]|nr:MAG: hypothetical protein BV458_03505 [Thermoplasmata archaeon M9B2D]